jgi:putative tryptophan/tyrosine transport system substrate-binding protein
MLKDIQPTLGRVAVLRAQGDPNVVHAIGALESAASLLGIRLSEFEIDSARNLPTVFSQIEGDRAEALVSVAGAFTYMNSKAIGELSLRHRLPSCHGFKETVASGGLLSLGPNMVTIAIQGASYVDKIIRGATPSELPVQQPTILETAVNLRTARALGLTIPEKILATADVVIE